MSYFIVPKQAMRILRFYPQLIASFVAAPLPADAEQHRGGAQLDHHLPHAHEHHGPLHEELTTVSR